MMRGKAPIPNNLNKIHVPLKNGTWTSIKYTYRHIAGVYKSLYLSYLYFI